MPDDVAAGGEILPTEEAAKEFGNACKVHRCIQVSPERESVRGFFFAVHDVCVNACESPCALQTDQGLCNVREAEDRDNDGSPGSRTFAMTLTIPATLQRQFLGDYADFCRAEGIVDVTAMADATEHKAPTDTPDPSNARKAHPVVRFADVNGTHAAFVNKHPRWAVYLS